MLIALLNNNLNMLKLNFYIMFLLYFLNFKFISSDQLGMTLDPAASEETSQECSDLYPLIGIECLKNKLIFEHKAYQAHNFAMNKKGDLVIEFTEYKEDELSSSRLFYGLTNQGRYFFSNETSYTYESNINIDNDDFWDYGYNDEYYYYEYFNMYKTSNLFV